MRIEEMKDAGTCQDDLNAIKSWRHNTPLEPNQSNYRRGTRWEA